MAEQKMRYRFVRAFIVEGLFASAEQEIVLLEQLGEGRKFVLTSAPDPFLADADVSAARGAILGSRITVAGAPPPAPLAPMGVILERIRSQRETHLDGRLVLVCEFEGTTAAITSFPPGTEGQESLILSQAEIGQITGEDEKVIDRAIASLFVADPSVVRCEPLAQSLTLIDAAGSKRIVMLFDMSLLLVTTRRQITPDKEAQFKNRFARCFNSNRDLKTVTRLLSDSLLAGGNKLRGFLAAWTSLEIFIKKFSTKVPLPPDDEKRKVPALINWFNSLCEELGLENQAAKASTFEKVKTVREQVFHYGEDMDDSSFPIEDTQNLVRAFLEKIR
jgi:hypothetical protein